MKQGSIDQFITLLLGIYLSIIFWWGCFVHTYWQGFFCSAERALEQVDPGTTYQNETGSASSRLRSMLRMALRWQSSWGASKRSTRAPPMSWWVSATVKQPRWWRIESYIICIYILLYYIVLYYIVCILYIIYYNIYIHILYYIVLYCIILYYIICKYLYIIYHIIYIYTLYYIWYMLYAIWYIIYYILYIIYHKSYIYILYIIYYMLHIIYYIFYIIYYILFIVHDLAINLLNFKSWWMLVRLWISWVSLWVRNL